MKTINNSRHQWNEIIFDNRNKLYGAYELRETYHVRIVGALILSFAFITTVIVTPLIISHYFSKTDDLPETHEIICTVSHVEPAVKKTILAEPLKPRRTSSPKQSTLPVATNDSLNTRTNRDVAVSVPSDNSLTADAGTNHTGQSAPAETPAPANTGIALDPSAVHPTWQVDKQPEFPGGTEAFYSFLRDHIRYPSQGRDMEGTVYMSFVINKEGLVTNVKLEHGIGYGFDEEAMKVINTMPKWKPGIYRGEQVSTALVLPVKFVLMK